MKQPETSDDLQLYSREVIKTLDDYVLGVINRDALNNFSPPIGKGPATANWRRIVAIVRDRLR